MITLTLTNDEAITVWRAVNSARVNTRNIPVELDRLWESISDKLAVGIQDEQRTPGDVLDDCCGDVYLSEARL